MKNAFYIFLVGMFSFIGGYFTQNAGIENADGEASFALVANTTSIKLEQETIVEADVLKIATEVALCKTDDFLLEDMNYEDFSFVNLLDEITVTADSSLLEKSNLLDEIVIVGYVQSNLEKCINNNVTTLKEIVKITPFKDQRNEVLMEVDVNKIPVISNKIDIKQKFITNYVHSYILSFVNNLYTAGESLEGFSCVNSDERFSLDCGVEAKARSPGKDAFSRKLINII